MAIVKLKSIDGDEKDFSVTHAQGILDLNRRNNTKTWALDDPKYTLDSDGKIISNPDPGSDRTPEE